MKNDTKERRISTKIFLVSLMTLPYFFVFFLSPTFRKLSYLSYFRVYRVYRVFRVFVPFVFSCLSCLSCYKISQFLFESLHAETLGVGAGGGGIE